MLNYENLSKHKLEKLSEIKKFWFYTIYSQGIVSKTNQFNDLLL